MNFSMRRHMLALGLGLSTAALGVSPALAADGSFNRISSFPVIANIEAGGDKKQETSAEIIVATADGQTLVYTDGERKVLGFIGLSDPKNPTPGGAIDMKGEPTSVVVAGQNALVGVNTSKDFVNPSGHLAIVDISSQAITGSCDLGGQPDSVALHPNGSMVAVAIENERDEDLNDGVIPQLPAGYVALLPVSNGAPDCTAMTKIDLTGLAEIAGDDPEPEFVDFNDNGDIVVTLQENNHIAVIDSASGQVTSHFSAGTVSLKDIDVKKDKALTFTASLSERRREPDAVKWLDNDRFVTANEGDYEGGARGFTIFTKSGDVVYEAGASLEHEIIRIGHYPDKRSGKKGNEPEGLEVGTFNGLTYFFVTSERGSVVAVYRDTGNTPELVQILPAGAGPESAVALPDRNLVVVANEKDLIEDKGPRAYVMAYQWQAGAKPDYPHIRSDLNKNGQPIGWGALSGLVADAETPGKLYAVSDSFYAKQPAIFTIDASVKPARITQKMIVTKSSGKVDKKLDLEGIALAEDGGFWLVSEGRPKKEKPHRLLKVSASGEMVEEIPLPASLLAHQKRFSTEGVTTIGSGDETHVWIAIQREWKDDPKGHVKLLRYQPATKAWAAVHYPLETADKGWVGLSEITAHDGKLYILERDNQHDARAKVKRLYSVALAGLQPSPLDGTLPVVSKTLVRDLLPDMRASNGYVLDKIEGFAIDASGTAFTVTDNDGVDDSSGETLFFSIGKL